MHENPPKAQQPPELTPDTLAAYEERYLQRVLMSHPTELLHTFEDLTKAEYPQRLQQCIDMLPDTVRIVSEAEASSLDALEPANLPNGMEYLVDYGEPSDLERLFVTIVAKENRETLEMQWAQNKLSASHFTVQNSMRCLRDFVRTKRFISAVQHAVQEQEDAGKEVIHVCDAGTGATALFGIVAALQSPRVHCTCIENNPNAVQFARVLVNAFGIADRVQVVCTDATTYEPTQPIDILVSETMDTGLIQEPQIAMMHHFAPFLSEGGIMVPDTIETYAAVVPLENYHTATHFRHIDTSLYPVIKADWEQSGVFTRHTPPETEIFAVLPTGIWARKSVAVQVASRVLFHDSSSLEIGDSRITVPFPVRVINDANGELGIRYKPGTHEDIIRIV